MNAKESLVLTDNIAGINQILPHKHLDVWKMFLDGVANNWSPREVNMTEDVKQWKDHTFLTEDERLLVRRCLGFFAGAESLVSNNLLLSIFKYVTDPECRQYILRQAYEECYADGTEVLTQFGWRDIKNLTKADYVVQVNEDGTSEFVEWNNRVEYKVGKLWKFSNKNGQYDLLVTSGHRMVYQDEEGGLKTATAEDITYSHKRPVVAAPLRIDKTKKITALSDYQRFLIAFQADGSFVAGENRDGSRNGGLRMLTFNLKKKRKKDRLINLVEKLGFRHTIDKEDDQGRTTYWIWIPISNYISKTFDGLYLADKSRRWCQEFIEELAEWDGWKLENYELTGYDSTIEKNIDTVQAISALAGYRCHRGLAVDDRSNNYSDLHRLSFNKDKTWVSRGVVTKERVEYKGKVRCISVPSGMLLVRWNGRVCVSGNSLHNWTVVTCCDSYSLSLEDVYQAYQSIPSIREKDEFLMKITTDINRDGFTTSTLEGKREFLRNAITYYIVCEGIFFFAGFAMILALGRQNKLQGLADQIKYTLRDETIHVKFGTYLINTIRDQYPEVWTDEFELETIEHIKIAVELEVKYAYDVLPRGILGLNAEMFVDYMQYIANRRMENLRIAFKFEQDRNPFPWLAEIADIVPMTNFFERKVREYQQGGTLDDDF